MDRSLPGSSVRGDFSGKNAGVGCHFLLQGTFLDQGSNPRLLHWQADSLPLSQQGSRGGAEELAQKLSDLPEPKAGLGREGMGERGWGWASRRVRAARELHTPRALCVAGTVQSLIQPICLNLYL